MATVAAYPPTPFVYNMGNIYPGKTFFISGFIPPNANSFNVNFESKPWGPDIAFHCDIRLKDKVIVLNNFTNNVWGPEERHTKDFPVAPRDFFEMTIHVEQEGFKSTPYVGAIQVGLTEGATIHVRGNTEKHHAGFLISLQCGGSTDPRSDCALAFNPRFNENQVIRNSLQSGSWGPEERHGRFPFQHGASVDVSIVVHAGHYTVKVDGSHFCDYNHRIPLHRVSHISVEQGIRIREIVFEAPMGYPHPATGYPGIPGPVGPILNPPTPFVHNMGPLYPAK